jgi:uncharacterized C2H2 Zn-finger protein
MRAFRREFSISDQLAIIRRATDEDGRIRCERCGHWMKSRKDYEIDHVLAEGMRPEADKKRKLTRADGQLLCVAVCHPEKTRRDKQAISEAARRAAYGIRLDRPGKVKMRRRPRDVRPALEVAPGPPALMRRGFEPARR